MPDEIENAQIGRTFLGIEDHGMLSFTLIMEGESWGQGFGNIALDGYNRLLDRREGWANGFMLIRAILETLEVDSWEKLQGVYCRVKRQESSFHFGNQIIAIGHITKNKWADTRDFIEKKQPV